MSDKIPSAALPRFNYVVVSPFLGFARGERISDAKTIAHVEKHYLPHVVRVAAA